MEHAVAKLDGGIHNTLTDPFEKSKTFFFFFASSIMKNILLFAPPRFPVNLICFIDFGSVSSACYLLKSITIIL